MEDFAEVLKRERQKKGITLRELASHVNKSISYLSDIEQRRKGPPDTETVIMLQTHLGISNNLLVELAEKQKTKIPTAIENMLKIRSKLSELLSRAAELPDEDLDQLSAEALLLRETPREKK